MLPGDRQDRPHGDVFSLDLVEARVPDLQFARLEDSRDGLQVRPLGGLATTLERARFCVWFDVQV